ncbi:MAG TPA: lantibiotic dehydratase, partial [Longimicrobium sp.]
ELRASSTRAAIDQLLAAEAHLHAEREAVAAILFYAIGASGEDAAARKRLIALKREWYNLRPVPVGRVEEALRTVASAAAERARAFGLALTQRDALAADARAAYAAEMPALRTRFRSLLGDADFLKGLLISSRALHGATARYVKAGGELSGKEEKTERGLLRYYTRMATKATPFSTFCAILPGAWVEDDGGPDVPRFRGDPLRKRSFVRVNKMLYGLLLDHLKTRPAFRRALEVEPNPTLRNEGGKLVYLTALEGREVFQRLNHNEVLDLIGAIFGGPTSPTLADLIAALSADPQIDATPEEAEAYLDRLIEIGFLRFRTGIREQDADWDIPFRELLDRIDDEHAARSSVLLAHVRERTDAYGAAPPEERAAIRDEILAATTAAFEEMELKGRLRRDMPFYEDATGDATAEVALTPGVRRAFAAWESWTRLTTRLAWPRPEQATMRHFFDTFYKGEHASVPLLQFYEDFFREHFKAHVEKEAKMRGGAPRAELEGYNVANPFELEFITAMTTARTRLTEAFALRWREAPDAEEISVTAAEVEAALSGVENSDSLCRSVGSFAVLAPRGDDPFLVLGGGSYTVGYGKYFSRFLYMLPDEVQEMVRRDNAALTGELLAEICGDAQFNANLHPPLLRWEISYPTGEGGVADEQLRSSDLRVELSPEDPHNLLLRHAPTGARVVPVDLGFLNPRMRPPLYQLLSRFTPPATFSPYLPDTPDPKPVVAETAMDAAPAEEAVEVVATPDAAIVDGPAAEAAAVTMGDVVADTVADAAPAESTSA